MTESGCDDIVAVGVWYKRQSVDEWSYRAAGRVNQTKLTIDYLTFEPYEVKITATNNENFSSASEIFIANLQLCKLFSLKDIRASQFALVPYVG